MKRFLTILCVLIMLIVMFLSFNYGCIGCNSRFLPEFVTEYSEEEHLERVKEIAINKFNEKYIADIKAETLYAYYRGTPEYVLITVELAEQLSGDFYTNTKKYEFSTYYLHAVIRTHEDEYYKTHISRARNNDKFAQVPSWLSGKTEFIFGPNPYQVCGYGVEYKKYYMNEKFAIERDGKIMEFYKFNDFDDAVYTLGLEPYAFTEKEVSLKTQKTELVQSYRNQYYTSRLHNPSKFS